jgi:hypothetical protein
VKFSVIKIDLMSFYDERKKETDAPSTQNPSEIWISIYPQVLVDDRTMTA